MGIRVEMYAADRAFLSAFLADPGPYADGSGEYDAELGWMAEGLGRPPPSASGYTLAGAAYTFLYTGGADGREPRVKQLLGGGGLVPRPRECRGIRILGPEDLLAFREGLAALSDRELRARFDAEATESRSTDRPIGGPWHTDLNLLPGLRWPPLNSPG